MRTGILFIGIVLVATPAHAWSGVQIPEPSNLALFGFGLAGLAIGRFASRIRRKRDEG